jgi:hypothetical protein
MFHMLALMPPVGYYWNSGVCMCQSATRKSKVPAFSQPCGRVFAGRDSLIPNSLTSRFGGIPKPKKAALPRFCCVISLPSLGLQQL